MSADMHLLDVVALTKDIPDHGLRRGQVGTIVEILGPETFEVEFADNNGRAYATLSLNAKELMVLHYQSA
jgi:hypothetical protein